MHPVLPLSWHSVELSLWNEQFCHRHGAIDSIAWLDTELICLCAFSDNGRPVLVVWRSGRHSDDIDTFSPLFQKFLANKTLYAIAEEK